MWLRDFISRNRIPRRSWSVVLTVLLLAAAIGIGLKTRQIERWNQGPWPVSPTLRYDTALTAKVHPGEASIDIDKALVPRPIVLERRQTLGNALADLGLNPRETDGVVTALADYLDVRKIRPGTIGLAYFGAEPELSGLRFELAGKGWVELARAESTESGRTKSNSGWSSSLHEFVRRVEVRVIEGELENMLDAAILRAGGKRQVAYAMSNVLQWDLDFNRDLRVGDRFRLVYEEVFLDGDYAGLGDILAMIYETRDRRFEAYQYGAGGYYDGEGRPLQKMFLRSPLPFTRVTSRFSNRRFHPVLKVHRPHYGVDYGAPKGTPVRVTAGGVVDFVGRSGGAGNMVRVRHPNSYETSYLHLSGYARGVRRGRHVSQGDVVGYVGSTGLSTGPHLDYRVKRNGRWMDPLKLKSEPIASIPEHEMPVFLARRDDLRTTLETGLMPATPSPPRPRSTSRLAERRNPRALSDLGR